MIHYNANGSTHGMLSYSHTVDILKDVISSGDKTPIDIYVYANFGTKFKMELQSILAKYNLHYTYTTINQVTDAIYAEIVSNYPNMLVTPEKCVVMLKKKLARLTGY